MRRTLTLLILGGVGLVTGTAALAGEHCESPMRDWRPREAVVESARKLGVEVRRIRTDDGCYKVYGRTADGRSIELEMDPVTLKVLETEYRDRPHGEEHLRRREPDRDARPATRVPAARAAVPANPLIGPATGVTK